MIASTNYPPRYIPPASICWCVDARQVIIVDEGHGVAHTLTGLPAALWQWLSLGYNYPRLVEFTAQYLNCPLEQADQPVNAILTGWLASGLLEQEYNP
jgi:hypothetical protein